MVGHQGTNRRLVIHRAQRNTDSLGVGVTPAQKIQPLFEPPGLLATLQLTLHTICQKSAMRQHGFNAADAKPPLGARTA